MELNMPLIPDGSRIAYGGDQKWCRSKWKQLSGCGPTAGANLSAYYAAARPELCTLYPGSTDAFERGAYTDCIEEIFRYITPGFMGYPYAKRFVRQYTRYAADHNVRLSGTCIGEAESPVQLFDFARRSIDSGNPLALLVLGHRAPELKEDTWHWVTVSGYTDGRDDRQLIVSNCGERQLWQAEILFERHRKNYVRLLHFVPASSPASRTFP